MNSALRGEVTDHGLKPVASKLGPARTRILRAFEVKAARLPRPLLAPVFFAALAVGFFAPALFTGRVLLPLDGLFLYPPWTRHAAEFGVTVPNNHLVLDTILQNYSWKTLAARSYATGQFPLWNPYILAGEPFLATAQNASLYPPGVLFYLLPWGHAYGWFAALHLMLGGVLTYWFVRVIGGSRFGGLIAGTTFAFCGFLMVSVLWPMVVSTAVWLPGVLAVVELLVRGYPADRETERRRDGETESKSRVPLVLLGATMVTLQFLAGHLEMSLYLLIAAGLYAGLRLVGQLPTGRRSLGRTLLAAFLLLAMVGLGGLGAAVQLVPFAEAISANVRSGLVSYDDVRGFALPRDQLVAFVVPDFFGNPSHHAIFDLWSGSEQAIDRPLNQAGERRLGTEWGPKNYVEGTAYLGILPLLLALVALARRRDGPTWALAALAGLSLLMAFGTPIYGLFFGLPGVNQLHTPFRWVYPYSLCVAVLGGLGASTIVGRAHAPNSGRRGGPETDTASRPVAQSPRHPIAPSSHRSITAVGWLGVGVGTLGSLALLVAWPTRDLLLGLADGALRRSRTLADTFPDARALFSYEWANLLGLTLLLLASGLVLLALTQRAPGAKAVALGLLAGDLFTFAFGFNTVADPAPLSFVPPEIRAIQADDSLFRIATLGEDDVLPANTNMLFGLHDIRGYDTLILREYAEYLELIEPQRGLLYSKIDKLVQPRSLDSPLLDLLNVKYVLTTMRLHNPGWGLVHDGAVRVYENQRVLPRAFLANQALLADDPAVAIELLARPEFNPRQQVVLEGVGLPPTPSLLQPDFRNEAAYEPSAGVRLYEPNRATIDVMAPRPSYLVFSDIFFPGWQVRVDGAERPLLRANRIFRAVEVEEGRHEVTFEYRPLSFRLGAVMSALAFGLMALTLAAWSYTRLVPGTLATASPVARVARNSLFPLATGLVNRALDFVFALIYLRLLGPQGTGAYTFAVVIVGYFDILVNFGLGTLLTREVARSPANSDRYFWNTLATRGGLAVAVLLGAVALAGPLAHPLEIGPEVGVAIVVLTLGMLPGALASTASAVFIAHERMEVPAAVTVLSTLAKVGLGTAALLAGWGIVGLAVVALLVNVLGAVVLSGLMGAMLGWPRVTFDGSFSRGLLWLSWPLMLNNLLNSLFFRIDAVLLKPLAGEVALGYYATAYKFIDGLQIIPSTFVLALFPILSRQAATDRGELARAFSLGLKVLLVVALPISVGSTLLAEPIVGLLAGSAFLPESALALQILIWFLPLSFVNGLTQYVLIALNRQRWITLSFFVGAVGNLALNLWAIPRYGFVGAAVVTVVSEWVLLAPFWYAVRQQLPPVPLLSLIWRPTLAALIMGLAVWWLRDFNAWLSIPVGALIYGAVLLALGTVSRGEVQALQSSRAR
jgi:O-antigen/teichoic acid export membrane protein